MNSSVEVLDGWRGRSLDEILERCRELVEDPEYPTVQRWREEGGKVVVRYPFRFSHDADAGPG